MEDKEGKMSLNLDRGSARAYILSSGADQLAQIIYETIQLRETEKIDLDANLPSVPSEHA